ncbi:MAG: hypothetical protein U0S48_19605 [Solirubrobacteraceae bacterium]
MTAYAAHSERITKAADRGRHRGQAERRRDQHDAAVGHHLHHAEDHQRARVAGGEDEGTRAVADRRGHAGDRQQLGGDDGGRPALAEHPGQRHRRDDDEAREDRPDQRRVEPHDPQPQAAQVIHVLGARVERERDPGQDPGDLRLVLDAERERAVVVARQQRAQPGADQDVVDVAIAHAGQTGGGGGNAEAPDLDRLGPPPAGQHERHAELIADGEHGEAGEHPDHVGLGLEPGHREHERHR